MKKVFYTAIAILGFANLTMAQVPSYLPTNGLVGFWPFNGNANDASGNGNNGVNNGGTLTTDRNNIASSAYYFSSAACATRIDATINTSSIVTGLTISVWILRVGNGCAGPRVLEFYNPLGNPGTMDIGWDDNGFGNIGSYTSTSNVVASSWTKPSNNIWTHLVYTNDGTFGRFYQNGILFNSTSSTGNPVLSGNAAFGRMNHPDYDAFNGKLDDIGIWNRALTQLEVTALYRGCSDTIITQPSNISGNKGSNKTFSFIHSGTGNSYQWQSNSVALGWQNVPNSNQYMGTTTNSLTVNGLSVSNHNQLFRVITSKSGCLDTSNIVTLMVSDIATDSLRLLDLVADSMDNIITVTNLKTDTTNKGNTIRQLQTDLANKHDTLYVGSNITTDTLKISIRTGIVNTSLVINSLKVYPNPAATLLNIELEKPGYYIAKLSSVIGQTLVTPTSGSIDISNLSNGVYLLTIYDSNNKLISTNKVLIVK
jgi:hypothetical protein